MLMKNENAAPIQGMDTYQQQPRNVNNGRWAARIRAESEITLEPEPDLIFDRGHKPFADIAMLELHEDDAQAWANSDNPRVRLAVAANLTTGEEILDELAGDAFPLIRALVASNPSASLDTIHLLCSDGVDLVASTAKDHLADTRAERLFNHRCVVRWTYL
jgi:hypothetical protein